MLHYIKEKFSNIQKWKTPVMNLTHENKVNVNEWMKFDELEGTNVTATFLDGKFLITQLHN